MCQPPDCVPCRNPGLNQGPLDLQSNALPTELFRLTTKEAKYKLLYRPAHTNRVRTGCTVQIDHLGKIIIHPSQTATIVCVCVRV